MEIEKRTINEKEHDVLIAKENHILQIKAKFSITGDAIIMGSEVIFGTNYWVKNSPIEDSEEFYEEVKETTEIEE